MVKRIVLFIITIVIAVLAVYYLYPYDTIAPGIDINKITVHKAERKMRVYASGQLLHTYTIALGRQPIGAKQVEGDGKTPEGSYIIDTKNPHSMYHKNMGISYPSAQDMENAKAMSKKPGGDIKIHGLNADRYYAGRFQRWADWTNGCIALTNEEMDDLYKHTPVGTVVVIYP